MLPGLCRGQKHGAVIIKALIQINREQMKEGGRWTHRKYPVCLRDVDSMNVEGKHVSRLWRGGAQENRMTTDCAGVCVCVLHLNKASLCMTVRL